ncbi:MAG: glycosyltransferase family 4 protein [Microgenomates group bacterium]
MKIGIDISQIVYGGGVSVYTKNLVENLLKIDKKNEYIFFFSSFRKKIPTLKLQFSNFQIRNFKFPPTILDFLWNKLHILPIESLIGKVDVFHTSDWLEPPARCFKVTTIHDLTPFIYPEDVHPKIRAVHQRKLEWVKKESKLIIAVSHSTKRDIVKILGIPNERIRVIYEGVDLKKFKIQSSKFKIEEIKKKYKIKGEYFLAFAGPKRKNLERIKKAVKGFNLFVIGQPYVEEQDLPFLYKGALGLIYASTYEGFGLPILEAQACGCPVITSNISSMPEVAGEGAILVNPFLIGDIKRGIKKLVENKKFKEELIKKGLENVKRFSWEKTAQETLKVYEEAIKC